MSSFFFFDTQGSTRLLTSILGLITDVYSYMSFGIELQSGSGTLNDLRYIGQFGYKRERPNVNLARMRRLFSADGQWDRRDPIGLRGTFVNLLTYVGNSPTRYSDPSGLAPDHKHKCKQICGPKINTPLKNALDSIDKHFQSLGFEDKVWACSSWDNLLTFINAWDIKPLHGEQEWILDYGSLTCATPACNTTVQVDNQCFYAGSVNYAMFGKMIELCCPKYKRYFPLWDSCEDEMTFYITLYKSRSGNFESSIDWALAGYRGWPATAGTPQGDRGDCLPTCSTPYHSGPFKWHWVGVGDFT